MNSDNILCHQYSKEISCDNPSPRFGHTINIIFERKIVLFGGTLNSGKKISSELYLFDSRDKYWLKLNSNNSPKGRAAHASASIKNKVIYYGGLINIGQYADDNLLLLEINENVITDIKWRKIPNKGKTPGKRYGHTMEFLNHNLFLYGGSFYSEQHKKNINLNDIWIFDTNCNEWTQLKEENKNDKIPARVYHTFCLYNKINRENDTLVLYGGRDSNFRSLNDLYILMKKKNNNYQWEHITTKVHAGYQSISRYQHASAMFGPFLFIMGGLSTDANFPTFDVFSFISNSWFSFGCMHFYRHNIWIYFNDSEEKLKLYLYIYGGFDKNRNNELNNKLYRINIFKLFSDKEELKKQLNHYLLILKNNNIIYCNNISFFPQNSSDDSDSLNEERDDNNDDINENSISDNDDGSDNEDNSKLINMLGKKKITKDFIWNAKSKRCSICLEDYSIYNYKNLYISYLPCFHYFHSKCINKWLHNSKKCPLCNSIINFNDFKDNNK